MSFAASQGLNFLINPTGWIAQRRIVVWFNDTRAGLFSYFAPLEHLWDAAMLVLRTVFGGATIPLLWLAVARIVYGVSMPDWRGAAGRVVGGRADRVFDRAAAGRKKFSDRGWRVPQSFPGLAEAMVPFSSSTSLARSTVRVYSPLLNSFAGLERGDLLVDGVKTAERRRDNGDDEKGQARDRSESQAGEPLPDPTGPRIGDGWLALHGAEC